MPSTTFSVFRRTSDVALIKDSEFSSKVLHFKTVGFLVVLVKLTELMILISLGMLLINLVTALRDSRFGGVQLGVFLLFFFFLVASGLRR